MAKSKTFSRSREAQSGAQRRSRSLRPSSGADALRRAVDADDAATLRRLLARHAPSAALLTRAAELGRPALVGILIEAMRREAPHERRTEPSEKCIKSGDEALTGALERVVRGGDAGDGDIYADPTATMRRLISAGAAASEIYVLSDDE